MSNFGSFVQKTIDKSRGKSTSKRLFRNEENRRAGTQVVFEKEDALLKSLGGSIDKPSTAPGGKGLVKDNKKGVKARKKFMQIINKQLLKQSLLK